RVSGCQKLQFRLLAESQFGHREAKSEKRAPLAGHSLGELSGRLPDVRIVSPAASNPADGSGPAVAGGVVVASPHLGPARSLVASAPGVVGCTAIAPAG